MALNGKHVWILQPVSSYGTSGLDRDVPHMFYRCTHCEMARLNYFKAGQWHQEIIAPFFRKGGA